MADIEALLGDAVGARDVLAGAEIPRSTRVTSP